MLYWYIIWFYMSSQSWWITLIIHIRKYKQMNQGNVEYTQIRKDIKSVELKIRWTSALFVFTNYAICIYFAIIQSVYQWKYCEEYEFRTKNSFICIFTDIFQQVYRYLMIVLIFVMWCAEYFVYRELTKTMQTALHSIYNMRKKFLKRLLIISMVSLFIFIVSNKWNIFKFQNFIRNTSIRKRNRLKNHLDIFFLINCLRYFLFYFDL